MSGTTYHLRPRSGWLNDPNGMVRRGERWHVFFQHNPDAPAHDRIAWGHASSTDLAHWEQHPVAFGPTPGGPDAFGCWSGCYLPGLDRPAVAYSGIAADPPHSTVCVRTGSEDLLTWSSPTVVATTPPHVREMRDPFVLDHAGRRFAVLGAGLPGGEPALTLFGLDDPWRWEDLGVWLTASSSPVLAGAGPADVWECPQLVPVDDRWVLVLSLHDRGHLGDVVGCVGDLVDDGGVPRFVPERLDLLDTGSCFYAPQIALDGDPHPWVIGWAREEDRDPAERDHAGCMTLARRLVLVDGRARLVLDRRAEQLLGEELDELGPGEHRLQGAARVVVRGTGALVHPDLGPVALGEGDEAWVDDELVEVYPADAAPSTWRSPAPWTLRVEEGTATLSIPQASASSR